MFIRHSIHGLSSRSSAMTHSLLTPSLKRMSGGTLFYERKRPSTLKLLKWKIKVTINDLKMHEKKRNPDWWKSTLVWLIWTLLVVLRGLRHCWLVSVLCKRTVFDKMLTIYCLQVLDLAKRTKSDRRGLLVEDGGM